MQFNSIGRSSNFAQAGKAAADDTLKAFIASRRNAPDYGKIVEKGMENRSAEKRAAITTSAQVHQAGLKAKAGVQEDKILYGAKRKKDSAQRKAGALGAAGKMFGSIANAGGDKPLEPYKGRYSRDELNADIDKFTKEIEEIKAGIVEPVKPSTSTPSPTGGGGGSVISSGQSVAAGKGNAGSGGKYDLTAMTNYAIQGGFSPENARTMAAISMGESGGNAGIDTVQSGLDPNKSNEYSIGLSQINLQAHGDKLARRGWTENDLRDPVKNMTIAKEVYDEAGGFTPWSVYQKGLHSQYLQ